MALNRGLLATLVAASLSIATKGAASVEPRSTLFPHPDEKPQIGVPWTHYTQGPITADPRPKRPAPPQEALLWIPRVVFFPLYLTTEYLIRRPVGWLLTTAEKNDWARKVRNFFTFGTDGRMGIIPSGFYHFNFRPSGGLYFFADDAGVAGHALRATAMTGGERWWKLSFTDRWTMANHQLQGHVGFSMRPDFIFHGLGPQTLHEARTRYLKETAEANVQYELRYFRSSYVTLRTGFEHHFVSTSETTGHDPALDTGVAQGAFPAPPGPANYNLWRTGLYSFFDNRENHRVDGNGISARLNLEYAQSLTHDARWFTLTPRLGGHLDLGHNRILSLNLAAEHQFSLSAQPIPFSEQLTVGTEPHVLPGFWAGRLRGPAVLGVSLEYRYEIWALLDGTLFFTLGNVYSAAYSDLTWGSLRPSYGLGVSSIGRPDSKFNVAIAFGHDTFAQGGGFDGAQIMFGYRPNL